MRRERIEHFDPERIEMALVRSDHHQFASFGDRRDRNIGEARMPAGGLCRVTECAGDPCCSEIEGQHAVCIGIKDPIEPSP